MRKIKEALKQNSVNTLSLFSGAGGLDIGAIQAGAKIVWANDMMKDACDSYSINIGNHICQGDINSYIPSLRQYKGTIDLVIGGPPCQGFSFAGADLPPLCIGLLSRPVCGTRIAGRII